MRIDLFSYDFEYWIVELNLIKKLFLINLFIFLIMILLGFICSQRFDENIPILFSENPLKIYNLTEDLIVILKNNLFLVFYLLLGAITFGLISIVLFGWNAFFLGTGISSIVNMNSTACISIYIYIFFEFLSLTFAATAGEKIGIDFFEYLLETKKPTTLLKTSGIVILSVFFMIIAGIIETYYLHRQ